MEGAGVHNLEGRAEIFLGSDARGQSMQVGHGGAESELASHIQLWPLVRRSSGTRRCAQPGELRAQAAIKLEMWIRDGCDDYFYPVDLVENDGTWILSTRSTFQSMVDDLVHRVPVAGTSQSFRNGLVRAFAKIAGLVREKSLFDRVGLGGGTFHNTYLLRLTQALVQDGFEVFTPREVPRGDGGLSLGQAVIAHPRWLAR